MINEALITECASCGGSFMIRLKKCPKCGHPRLTNASKSDVTKSQKPRNMTTNNAKTNLAKIRHHEVKKNSWSGEFCQSTLHRKGE